MRAIVEVRLGTGTRCGYVPRMDSADGPVERGIGVAETVIYVVVAVILTAGSALLLGNAIYELVDGLGEGVDVAAAATLDALLLTFIFVELLSAVRSTVRGVGSSPSPSCSWGSSPRSRRSS